MKRAELFFNAFSIFVDAAAVFASAALAYAIRIQLADTRPILFRIDISDYLYSVALFLPLLLLFFAFFGLYNIRSTTPLRSELGGIVSAVTTSFLLIVLVFFFDRDIFPSRLIVLLSWLTTILSVGFGRIFVRFIRDWQLSKGRGNHRMAVIVKDAKQSSIVNALQNNSALGYKVVTTISPSRESVLADLQASHEKFHLDEIVQADPDMPASVSLAIVGFCHERNIRFNFVPDVFGVSASRMELEMLGGMPFIKLKNTPLDGWGGVAKRLLDILAALFALIIFSPFIVLIVLFIKLDSRGPILYKAPRQGKEGNFLFYKFRTMYTHLSHGAEYGGKDAEALLEKLTNESTRSGPVWKIQNDPRVARFGRFLRKTKLDEIPQFWHVLRGDMSMVGPRAHVLEQVRQYSDTHRRLFTIKPGLTGLTQITQMQQPNLAFDEEVKLDVYYIEHWSLWLDIQTICKTAWMLVTRKFSDSNT